MGSEMCIRDRGIIERFWSKAQGAGRGGRPAVGCWMSLWHTNVNAFCLLHVSFHVPGGSWVLAPTRRVFSNHRRVTFAASICRTGCRPAHISQTRVSITFFCIEYRVASFCGFSCRFYRRSLRSPAARCVCPRGVSSPTLRSSRLFQPSPRYFCGVYLSHGLSPCTHRKHACEYYHYLFLCVESRRLFGFLSFFYHRSLRSPAARCVCARLGPPLGGSPEMTGWGSSQLRG